MKVFKSANPYDQSVVAEHELMNDEKLQSAFGKAEAAFSQWRSKSFNKRSDLLRAVAINLRVNKETYAQTISIEMGKILKEARGEIEKCALACEFYAEQGERFLYEQIVSSDAKKSMITFQPIGAVLAIMPWNFPFWQVMRATIPCIMAGNVVLLKHAPNVTQCSKQIEKIFVESGAPEGLFQSLVVDIDVTEKIISQDIVQGVTLTGSEFAGSSVASLAGKHIKKSVLELGGSDPLIVLEDADLHQAASVGLQSRMQNAGQSCIASKRFIVIEKVKDEFVNLLIHQIKDIKQGDQLDEATTMGPMARIDLAEKLLKQKNDSLINGIDLITGGSHNGCNFEPTLLDNVKPGVPAFDEELFGPVASIIVAKNEMEAIRLANKNRYGLGASLWTKDLDRGQLLAKEINAGSVFINALVKSDPRLPFGGIKKSGYGRELSAHGIKEFTNIKTICVED
ncbi:MAG: NAD-dependent succinate-semialdehyde dehydrogenase [Chitinophagales bacterium]|nr:NAD-dependent succinate-semialdehyde dehydrogenase [Chitinophagales bacterium]